MPFLTIFTSLISGVGSFFGGLFGFKGEQAKTVQSALDVLKSVNDVDGQTITATANALSVILTQGSWLEKQWRPALMIMLITIVGCWFFGFVPPNFDAPISPMMDRVLSMLTIGVGGYIPCRTIEKVFSQMNIASILKTFIEKKIL